MLAAPYARQSDRVAFAERGDLLLGVAEVEEHFLGVLAESGWGGLDAGAVMGELERGERDRHGEARVEKAGRSIRTQRLRTGEQGHRTQTART